jgi:hypothetical protein
MMPKVMQGFGSNANKVVVSLCDYSGNWPRPWNKHGYTVVHFDLKHGDDCLDVGGTVYSVKQELARLGPEAYVDVVLAAPVCTVFTVSGARWWPGHDASGRTEEGLKLVDSCLWIIEALKPRVWALENPVGRLPKLRPNLGKPRFYFNPCDFADAADEPATEAYTKRTGIWGDCNSPYVYTQSVIGDRDHFRIEPVMYERGGKRGSWMWANLGGKSERTKELRSNTPQGFATVFFFANQGA